MVVGKVFIIDMGEGPVTGILKSSQQGEKVVDLTRPADWMWPRDRSVEKREDKDSVGIGDQEKGTRQDYKERGEP